MPRGRDFEAFLKSRVSPAESLDEIPDLPDGLGLDFLEAVDKSFPVADSPYEPSEIRNGGLKIWDSVYLPGSSRTSRTPRLPKDVSPLRSINSEWEPTKEALSMVGRPDGVHYIRPRGPCILDVMNDDIRMLQGAHILVHREIPFCDEDDYTFGQLSDSFLRWLVKLFAARKYGLLLNTHPEYDHEDAFSKYGIEVFGSSALRDPTLYAAASGSRCRLKSDQTVICLLGAVGIEAPPRQASKGTLWKESNKWSCLPTLCALSGWECVDYVTHAERVELGGDLFYSVPCADLQPMGELAAVLEDAANRLGTPEKTKQVTYVQDWLASEDFSQGLSVTPQLPCPLCLRVSRKSEGCVPRPMSKKPKKDFSEICESGSSDLKAWAEYVRFMRNCIAIGRRATAYATGSATAMKHRNSAFKKRMKKLRKVESLMDRCHRKSENGFLSEAAALKKMADGIKDELRMPQL